MRYKRLIFGANNAAEKLQQALQLILMEIDGTANITDDILVYTKTTKDHDKMLAKLLSFKIFYKNSLKRSCFICIY